MGRICGRVQRRLYRICKLSVVAYPSTNVHAPLTQWLEYLAYIQLVRGSNPWWCTNTEAEDYGFSSVGVSEG